MTEHQNSLPSKEADQHLYISHSYLLEIEKQARLLRHIERYSLLRQFAQGVVCDAACGCGYGSYLLSTNPDVSKVIGLDVDQEIIAFAQNEYTDPKLEFNNVNLDNWVTVQKLIC